MALRPDPKPEPRLPRSPKPLERNERSWASAGSAGRGSCIWCGKWGRLTWDHVLPRSRYRGEDSDSPINLVKACWDCNSERTRGLRPSWYALSGVTQAFVVKHIGLLSAGRMFTNVPQ